METTKKTNLQLTSIKDIDAKEFSLDDEKSLSISNSFQPKIIERDGFAEVFKQIIVKEITKEVCIEADQLRKKLVKVRTGIAEVHKTEKAYYLAAGKYCDALKNKLTLPIEQMEETLTEISNFYENQEAERKKALKESRMKILSEFQDLNPEFYDLENMTDESFDKLVNEQKELREFRILKEKEAEKLRIEAEKKAEEEKIEAEKKQAEIQRLAKITDEREKIALKLFNFIDDFEEINFHPSAMSDDQFQKIISDAENASAEYDKKQKQIEAENEKIRKEKEAAERKAKEIEAESLRKQKEAQQEAEKQKKEAEKREAELKKQIEAEKLAKEKAEAEERKKQQDILNLGDQPKMDLFIKDLKDLKTKYEFKSEKFIKLQSDIINLIDKTVSFAESKI